MLDYDLFLIGNTNPWTFQELVLPDGGRIRYDRTSGGSGAEDAEYSHTSTPTAFYKSTIKWNGNGWDFTLLDGTVYTLLDGTVYTFPDGFQATTARQAAPWRIRDRFGNAITLIRDSDTNTNVNRRLLFARSSSGRWLSFAYVPGTDRISQVTDNTGRSVSYTYTPNGELWKVTDAAGGITEFTYDPAAVGRLLTIKDPRGIVYLTNSYDASGRVATQVDTTSSYTFTYTVDGTGAVTQTDVATAHAPGRPPANAIVRRVQFTKSGLDTSGRAGDNQYRTVYPTKIIDALGDPNQRTLNITRNISTPPASTDTARVTSINEQELGRTTNFTYDSNGNLSGVTEAVGTSVQATTSFEYAGPFNQLSKITDPNTNSTTFVYDSRGALIRAVDPLGHTVTVTNNVAGQPLTIADHLGNTTTLGYTVGDLTSVAVPAPRGGVWRRWLDGAGRVVRTTDPLGNRTQIISNALNLPTQVTDALGGITALAYDGNGNLTGLTDARNHTTTFAYHNADQLQTRTDPLNRAESYGYGGPGRLTSFTDRKNQQVALSYDARHRITSVNYGAGGTVTYTYDPGDRLTGVSDTADTGPLSFSYDLRDRLLSEAGPRGTVSYEYDPAGRRTKLILPGVPNAIQVTYDYDNADRLTGISRAGATVGFTYDEADRLTSLTLPDGIKQAYTYDAFNQMSEIRYTKGATNLGSVLYSYDGAGRRNRQRGALAAVYLPAAVTSATYDAANRLTSWDWASQSSDNNGNLTADGLGRSYTWNARNQLTAVNGQNPASFTYDGLGRRVSKTVAGTTTSFRYDGLNLVQELTGSVGNFTVVAELLTGLGLDQTYSRTEGANTSSFLTDALGSTIALADGAGTIQTSYGYEPFGLPTVAGAASTNPYQFTGREWDGTGLQYSRARYYHPYLSRFISEDPLGFGGGDPSLYAYVGNSPTNFVDPLGLNPLAAAGGACAVVGLAGGVTSVVLAGRKANLGTFAQGAIGGCALGAGAVMLATTAAVYGLTGAASVGAARIVTVLAGGPSFQQLITVARQQYPGSRRCRRNGTTWFHSI